MILLRFLAIAGIVILAVYLALAAALQWGLIYQCDPDSTAEQCARADRGASAQRHDAACCSAVSGAARLMEKCRI